MRRPTRALAGPLLLLSFALLLGAAGAARAQSLPANMANKPGFPATIPGGRASHGEPVWADLKLPGEAGRKCLVYGTTAGKIFAVKWDGTLAWASAPLPGSIEGSPSVGDIDGDGIPEIVVGFGGGAADALNVGGVRALRNDGTVFWTVNGFNEPLSNFPLGVVSTPAIGDVDGDGMPDVAWGSFDAHIYVVDGKTHLNKPGWPLFVRDTIRSSPALYDLDNTGKLEVIIGTDSHADPTANPPGVPPTIAGGRLHVLRWNATEYPGFPKDVDEVMSSSPVVGDIDGDGKPEIVVGTGTFYSTQGGAASTKALYAWKCDGSVPRGWPYTQFLTGRVIGSPVLVDIDGNGSLDVIFSDWGSGGPNFVYAIKGDGTFMWKTAPKDFFGTNQNAGQPVVADVMGNGSLEVLVPTNTEICILSSTGAQLTADNFSHATKPSLFMTTTASCAAVDVDNSFVNIAAISATPFPAASDSQAYAWTTNDKTTSPPWGFFRRTPDRKGAIPGSGACTPVIPPLAGPIEFYTVTPCRVVDTRNPNGPYGGPTFAAGSGSVRSFTLAGQCGVPADATGISLNVTVADVTTTGSLAMFPGTGTVPNTDSISFRPGVNRANNVMVGLTLGVLSVKDRQASGSVNVVMDVTGYFR